MARKFKCRNGTILQEAIESKYRGMKYTDSGYQDEYIVLYDPTEHFCKGSYIVLAVNKAKNHPVGGGHGKGYDIVEELLPKKKRKIPVATNAVLYESSIHDDPPKWYRVAKEYQKKSKGIVLKYEQYPNAPEGDFHTTDHFYLNRDIKKLSKEEKVDLVVKLFQFLELPHCINTALDWDAPTIEIVIKC